MFGIGFVTKNIEPCTSARFYEMIESPVVRDTCALIARLVKRMDETGNKRQQKWCETNISKAKRSLPCITPMAHFKGCVRNVKNAIPSGLNMLDIDHVDNPAELWDDIRERCNVRVGCVHITPSTKGLRIIFAQPEGETIEGAQLNLARALGVAYDRCTRDLARCSFLVPRNYFLLIDDEVLFSHPCPPLEDMEGGGDGRGEDEGATEQTISLPQVGSEDVIYPTDYKGVPYSEIISVLLSHAGYDREPVAGERNNAVYMLARNLRYVCDFDVRFIIAQLPDWGLPSHEVLSTVESAVKSVRMATIPRIVTDTIRKAQKLNKVSKDEMYNPAFSYQVPTEGIIGRIISYQPEYLRNAAYLTCLASFGTLLTKLRGYGPDGSVLAPNFMVTISAPQASGKSFMKRVSEVILAPIKEADAKAREELRRIEKENRKNKDKEGYEEQEFEGAIRLLPPNVSNRVLLERLDKARGQHLMIIAEEIDSMTKAEKSGKWAEKSDVYRLAYDNSEWGQDYASENSYHAVVKVFLNLLFSGTPAAVNRFFNDIENGLITRFLFIDLPDTYGQKRPQLRLMDEETRRMVGERVKRAYEHMQHVNSEDGFYWIDTTQMVKDAELEYDEVQRQMYLANQDDVCRDLARRRYCNYLVLIMMIEAYLNDGVYTAEIKERAIGIVNLCTEQLIANYGDLINKSLNESAEKQDEAKKRTRSEGLLDALPAQFTADDYKRALSDSGQSAKNYVIYLHRLVKGGKIERIDRGIYRKI